MAKKPKTDAAAEHDLNTGMTDYADDVEIAQRTCKGDLRDSIVEIFKRRPKPWGAMKEDEQRDFVASVEQAAESLIRKVAVALASRGQVQVMATLKQVNMKGGLKITAESPFTIENIELLSLAMDKTVIITRADASDSMGQRKPAKIDKDQKDLLPQAPEGDTDLADTPDPQPSLNIGEQARKDFEEDEAKRKADEAKTQKPEPVEDQDTRMKRLAAEEKAKNKAAAAETEEDPVAREIREQREADAAAFDAAEAQKAQGTTH